ncbi:hypothetical protein JB92DRAFT_421685 [Gautieria morchelliformis]|nr:hypothetical protein JB92DRAFT_421685 [Gautieria morchelliformis]
MEGLTAWKSLLEETLWAVHPAPASDRQHQASRRLERKMEINSTCNTMEGLTENISRSRCSVSMLEVSLRANCYFCVSLEKETLCVGCASCPCK